MSKYDLEHVGQVKLFVVSFSKHDLERVNDEGRYNGTHLWRMWPHLGTCRGLRLVCMCSRQTGQLLSERSEAATMALVWDYRGLAACTVRE